MIADGPPPSHMDPTPLKSPAQPRLNRLRNSPAMRASGADHTTSQWMGETNGSLPDSVCTARTKRRRTSYAKLTLHRSGQADDCDAQPDERHVGRRHDDDGPRQVGQVRYAAPDQCGHDDR